MIYQLLLIAIFAAIQAQGFPSEIDNEEFKDLYRSVAEENNACIEKNKDYIKECQSMSIKAVFGSDDTPKPDMKDKEICELYIRMKLCVPSKIEEKCGAAAAESMVNLIDGNPENLKKKCADMSIF